MLGADGTGGDVRAVHRSGGEVRGADYSVGQISCRCEALIWRKKLETRGSVVAEPHPQAKIGLGEDHRSQEGIHQGRVTEEHGVKSLCDWERDTRRRLAAGDAAAVVAPVGDAAGGIDEGEFELARALEIDRRCADRDAALVVNERRCRDRLWWAGEEERREGDG